MLVYNKHLLINMHGMNIKKNINMYLLVILSKLNYTFNIFLKLILRSSFTALCKYYMKRSLIMFSGSTVRLCYGIEISSIIYRDGHVKR
jgi:hypothetical protein